MRKGLFFLACIGCLFLCRDKLLDGAVFLALRSFLPHALFEGVQYRKVSWKDGKVVLKDLKFEGESCAISVDKVICGLQGDVALVRPHVVVFEGHSLSAPVFLSKVHLRVEEGVIHLHDKAWYCDYADGLMRVACDTPEGRSLCGHVECSWTEEGEALFLRALDLDLGAFIPGIASARVEFMGTLWDTGGFSCHVACEDFGMDTGAWQCMAPLAELDVLYTPSQDGLLAKGQIQEGVFVCAYGKIEQVACMCELDGSSDPQVKLTGVWHGTQQPSPFSLHGRGSFFIDESPWFEGKIQAENVHIADYSLEKLVMRVQAEADELRLYEVKAEDVYGSLSIEEIILMPSVDTWDFYVPSIEISRHSNPEPVAIEALYVQEFSGTWGDTSSYKASGSISFISDWKESSLAAFENLGLEPALLNPASGQLAFELKYGKCFFTNPSRIYSLGGHSEFSLETESGPSYLDLDGALHVDLKISLESVNCSIEPFIFSIRGTIFHPDYLLN